ncbi:alpha/beta hydrolase family protein [Nonomuraea recticatena]|uniref:hypothetical protein n=1 Tax=Nonomuraea recticatena TaxID=46178 RepID=UPI00360A25A9
MLESLDTPFLCAFSDRDFVLGQAHTAFRERIPGAKGLPHTTIVGGGHFVQEDQGPRLAQIVDDFIRSAAR